MSNPNNPVPGFGQQGEFAGQQWGDQTRFVAPDSPEQAAGRVDPVQADPGALNYGQPVHHDQPTHQQPEAATRVAQRSQAPGQRAGATQVDRSMLPDNPRQLGDNRSMGEIMGDLSRDFSTLMRQEVALAKAEISQSAKSAGKGAGLFGGAGIAAHMTLLFLSLALWWMIAHLLGDIPKFGWSFLIVAVLWGIAAGVMAMVGKKELEDVNGVPQTQQTIQQIPDALKGNEEKNR